MRVPGTHEVNELMVFSRRVIGNTIAWEYNRFGGRMRELELFELVGVMIKIFCIDDGN